MRRCRHFCSDLEVEAEDRYRPVPRRNGRSLKGVLLLVLLAAAPAVLRAQVVPDTTGRVQPEPISPAVRQDSVRQVIPVGFMQTMEGEVVVDTIPARLPVWDPIGILEYVSGSFVYAFGTPGWPDAWSPFGYRPEQIGLVFQQLPFDDLVTGRPRYDLLPLAFLDPIRVGYTRYGHPVGVLTSLRPYDSPRPLTEIRYWTGADGLQSIEALHAQNRVIAPFGAKGVLGVIGGYGGRASDGEFPGSELRRERRLTGRMRFARPNWTLEITDLYNRQRVGAHGGVEEPIFQRLGASVINPDARRQTIRNDLSGTLRARVLGMRSPATFTAFWTAQSLLYDRGESNNGTDTVLVAADRFGIRVAQDWRFGRHRAGIQIAGWRDAWDPEIADTTSSKQTSQQFHATIRDSVNLGRAALILGGGLHQDGGHFYPSALVQLSRPLGYGRVFVSGEMTGQQVSGAERFGYGPLLTAIDDLDAGPVFQLEAGAALVGRVFDASATFFASQTSNALDVFAAGGDTARVFITNEPVRRLGVALDLGWRRNAERGFYATVQPTYLHITNDDTVGAHVPISESLPTFFGRGRFGARYLLFRGDLDLDIYLDGRFWTEMRSRTLHPPTGLLVLPADDAREIRPSGLVNVVIQAGVRTATFFIAWDNVLASSTGGGLYEGVLLVPDYPFPERRFRFGVYWPIQD